MTAAFQLLLGFSIAVPLMFAMLPLHPDLRQQTWRLAPLAPLPALVTGLLVPAEVELVLPDMLFGVQFGLDATSRIFLLAAALVWTAAAVHARSYLAADAGRHRFAALFQATMAGNMGLIVAQDVAAFYLFFSLMTLSAYVLVVHERTAFAYYAGRIYIVLSVAGEIILLLAFMLAASAAESLLIVDLRQAVATAAHGDLIVALLLVGFGIKAGIVPLHMWLPLAHPAAPTPGSAALSGAIIKAGILGLLLFLPLGHVGFDGWGMLLIGLGFLTAYYGVAVGLAQVNPKTILAYSSLSQMGVVLVAIGTALMLPAAAAAAPAIVALYAAHHGLAKGSLFLGVSVLAAARRRRLALAAMALPALAIAGAPLTSGALAKLALADFAGPAGDRIGPLLSLSMIGTTLLMARFLVQAGKQQHSSEGEGAAFGIVAPWLALIVAGFVAGWGLWAIDLRYPVADAISPYALWAAIWPLAIAAAIVATALLPPVTARLQRIRIPEGDLVAAAAPVGHVLAAVWPGAFALHEVRRLSALAVIAYRRADTGLVAACEERMRRWPTAGAAALIAAALLLGAVLID